MFYIKDTINIEKDARAKFRKTNNLKFSAGEKQFLGLHQEKKNILIQARRKKNNMMLMPEKNIFYLKYKNLLRIIFNFNSGAFTIRCIGMDLSTGYKDILHSGYREN